MEITTQFAVAVADDGVAFDGFGNPEDVLEDFFAVAVLKVAIVAIIAFIVGDIVGELFGEVGIIGMTVALEDVAEVPVEVLPEDGERRDTPADYPTSAKAVPTMRRSMRL